MSSVRRIVVATDDDSAGELIAWRLYAWLRAHAPETAVVTRARMDSMEVETIRRSVREAKTGLDADLLRSAIRREFARHIDMQRYPRGLEYFNPSQRAIIDLVARNRPRGVYIHAELVDPQTDTRYVATLVAGEGLSPPMLFDQSAGEFKAWAREVLEPVAQIDVSRVPPPYPASTTHRVLAHCAWELGMTPWAAMDVLQALYLQAGAE